VYTDIYGYIKKLSANLERTRLVLYRDKIFGIGFAMMLDAGSGMLDLVLEIVGHVAGLLGFRPVFYFMFIIVLLHITSGSKNYG